MAQGTRGRLLMAAATGFGVVLCTGLAGCQNTDKSKDKVTVKQPAPGLPGTPPVTNSTAVRPMPNYGTQTGTNLQPAGGTQFNSTMPLGAGLGGTSGAGVQSQSSQFGNPNNTLTSPPQQQNFNGGFGPGAPSPINAPRQPGMGYPSSAAPAPNPGMSLGANQPSPPESPLLPPTPPPNSGLSSAGGSVPPPFAPQAPPLPSLPISTASTLPNSTPSVGLYGAQ